MPRMDMYKEGIETRFKKGEAPGKPKGALNFATRLKKQVAREMNFPDVITNTKQKGQLMDAVISRLTQMALKGNMKAIDMLMNRVDGPMTQRIENVDSGLSITEQKEKLKKLTKEERAQLMKLMQKIND